MNEITEIRNRLSVADDLMRLGIFTDRTLAIAHAVRHEHCDWCHGSGFTIGGDQENKCLNNNRSVI